MTKDFRYVSSRSSFLSSRLQIFTSEEHELPRDDVANFLEDVDPILSIRYVEYLIEERKESSGDFHDRLGELYLHCALDPKLSPGISVISFECHH